MKKNMKTLNKDLIQNKNDWGHLSHLKTLTHKEEKIILITVLINCLFHNLVSQVEEEPVLEWG